MRQRRGTRTTWQDKFFEWFEPRIEGADLLIQIRDLFVFHQKITWYGKLAAQVKQHVLRRGDGRSNVCGHVIGKQHTQAAIEFVHITHGLHARAVLRHACAVTQAR